MATAKTKFSYYEEMRDLCLRASRAFVACEGEKSVMGDIYAVAEEGFYNKCVRLTVDEASRPLSEERRKRLEEFSWFVKNKEEAAAYAVKERANASN